MDPTCKDFCICCSGPPSRAAKSCPFPPPGPLRPLESRRGAQERGPGEDAGRESALEFMSRVAGPGPSMRQKIMPT